MKNLTTVSLFIFGVITAAILTAGLVFYQNKSNLPEEKNVELNNSAGSAPVNSSAAGVNSAPAITLNLIEISKHNKASDCWLIINNKVYNLTSYLSAHPGGAGAIIPSCGKEATAAFDTKGGRGNTHSSYANSLLANYLVGDLNQPITAQQIQTNAQNAGSVIPPPKNRGEDEFDD